MLPEKDEALKPPLGGLGVKTWQTTTHLMRL